MPKTRKRTIKQLEKKTRACEMRKCKAITKRKLKGQRSFKKLEKEKCDKLTNENEELEFFNCSNKIYEESGYDKLFAEWTKCSNAKCLSERKELAKAYNNM